MVPMEAHPPGQQQTTPAAGRTLRRALLLLSIAMMVLGGNVGPLFTRIYFLHGGKRIWLTSLLQNCGFPILLIPLSASYLSGKGRRGDAGIFSVTGRATAAFVALGVATGLNAYMYAYGSAWLPVSTSTLLISTQLAFTAGFAFLIVRQRFTAYSVNAVVLLVLAPVVLALQAGGDRPAGESRGQYFLGFWVMLGGAALSGLLMPLTELAYLKMKRKATHVLVMEMQGVMALSASAFCIVAMLINNKDFQAIPREAKEYGLGETKYYLVLAVCAVFWQLMNVGFVGVISCSSSLLAGIVFAVLVPLGEVLPVLALHEKFSGGKGVSVALSIWGFVSYLYGEYRQHKKGKQSADEGMALSTAP